MGKQHAHNLRRRIPEAHFIAVAEADLNRAKLVAAEFQSITSTTAWKPFFVFKNHVQAARPTKSRQPASVEFCSPPF
jgi:hypothetical protein